MDENEKELAKTIAEFITNINDRIFNISNKYREENLFEADRVVNLFDDLSNLAEGISVVEKSYASIRLSELQDILASMTGSLEKRDYSLFADLIQYELADLLTYWKDVMTRN